MTTYVDSSVVLRRLLDPEHSLAEWAGIEAAITSAITQVECLRALDRRRAAGLLTIDAVSQARARTLRYIAGFAIVALGADTLERVSSPFPTPLGTLDAIHLATALLWRESRQEDIQIATHDRQLALCARAVGIPVLGVA